MTNYPKGPLLHHQQLCFFIGQLSFNPSTSSRISLKVRYEKGQPLKSICHCIETWKLSMKIGKVYDDALME